MPSEPALIDTGPLVAVLSRNDQHHDWAARTLRDIKLPLRTCESVLSEAWFLLRRSPLAQAALGEMIESGFVVVSRPDLKAVARYAQRYHMDFADACLASLSEEFPESIVLTTDRRDFARMRRFGHEPIPFAAPSD